MASPDFQAPEQRKYDLPIIDAHVHLTDSPAADRLVETARLYGISRVLAVTAAEETAALKRRHGSFVSFAVWPDLADLTAPAFGRRNDELLARGVANGAVAVKFWFKPEFNAQRGLYLDDRRLQPLFAMMGERRLAALVHIADPDIWFARRYRDREKFLSKRDNYRQLLGALAAYPAVNFVAAHFGGDPEDLEHLDELLRSHANLYIDTSATKWLARELSRQAEGAREFIVAHAERILFGTDLVTYGDGDFDYFASRYWVQQRLWEGRASFTSPIEDVDAAGPVRVQGLDLPRAALEQLYWRNAARVYGLTA